MIDVGALTLWRNEGEVRKSLSKGMDRYCQLNEYGADIGVSPDQKRANPTFRDDEHYTG
jgi:hypothetical protein